MSDVESSGIVLLVGGDLNAVARVEAACAASGRILRRAQPEDLGGAIASQRPLLVLIDLDEVPPDVEVLKSAGLLSPTSPPTLGFYSHVDAERGRAAAAAGLQAVPRGRFWRELRNTISTL